MRALALILLCSTMSVNSLAKDAAGLFDKPIKTEKVALRPDPQNPGAKGTAACFYFKNFAIKQVDWGEVGAELSIIPLAAGVQKYKCSGKTTAGEIPFDAKEWSGYFKGVKGSYVFLNAADGVNGGIGFAVYSTPDAKKLFEDVSADLHAVTAAPSGLTLRYTRVYQAACSLYADPSGCWAKVKEATGVKQETPPDCAAPYKAEEQRMKGTPHQAGVATLPSVVDYEAQMVLQGGQTQISALGGNAACRLSE
jgi:hypothetical protein